MSKQIDIHDLLRVKRYEQPAPEYFEQFLGDFHRRQRAELLYRPLWKIALDRLQNSLRQMSLEQYAYATVAALVLVFTGLSVTNITPSSDSSRVAQSELQPPSAQNNSFSINSRINFPDLNSLPKTAHSDSQSAIPRYVIDARPVSYERPFSF